MKFFQPDSFTYIGVGKSFGESQYAEIMDNTSVIRQKGVSQNGGFKKTKKTNFPKK